MHLDGVVAIPQDVQERYVAAGLWDDVSLRDGLEAWARKSPARIAVVDASSSWTYERLEAAVARAVATLRACGVGPGTAVVVIAPLSAPALVAYLAVIRTGAVVVMLDRRCGRGDVEHAAALSAVSLLLSPAELVEELALRPLGRPVLTYDELLSGDDADRDWPETGPRAPIAVVFTSGTTSRPKGVVHSLNTLRSGARSMADAFQLTADDVAFLSTPLASITGLVQTHLMLDRGAGLILEDRFDPPRSLERLRTHGATVLGGAPVIIAELFKQAAREQVQRLPLRAMALGGTTIPRPVLELAIDRYGITPVRMYGASEIPCATGTVPADEGEARLGDDGAPARGAEVRADGELLVRGPMRFLGYLDEDDNRAAFTPGGWFRTGDLGRVEAGRLTVTGRLKEIVARKGMKISLAEVDEAARSLPGVEEVAAYGVPDAETGERLVLAMQVRNPGAVHLEAVSSQLLAGGLAKWKLPEQIVLWDSPLPRTESGKIQRRSVADGAPSRPTLLAPRLRATSERSDADFATKLLDWFRHRMPAARDVRFAGDVRTLSIGHSNETMIVALEWTDPDGGNGAKDVVIRMAPPPPGLLEPYDLGRQYGIIKALQNTSVPVPGIGHHEPDADVLGRPFFTMDLVPGTSFERSEPAWVRTADPGKWCRMAAASVRVMARLHTLDVDERLGFLGSGAGFAESEIARWEGDMRKVEVPLPAAFEATVEWLKANRPVRTARISLVHGDLKLGNLMWDDENIVAVLDWELAGVGDPIADLAYYLTVTYDLMPRSVLARGLARDEAIALYERESGIEVHDLAWYEVLQAYKLAVIMLLMYDRFFTGASNDLRFMVIGPGVTRLIGLALERAGIQAPPDALDLRLPPQRIVEGCTAALTEHVIPALDGTAREQAALLPVALMLLLRPGRGAPAAGPA